MMEAYEGGAQDKRRNVSESESILAGTTAGSSRGVPGWTRQKG